MAASGLTSSTNNLMLSGCYLYIDDDTNASGIISAEMFECLAEMAELFAGKGVKKSVYNKIKRFGVQFGFNFHEITPKALNILYGQNYSSDASHTIWEMKNKIVDPENHTFRIEAENVNEKTLRIYLYNAKNINFGQIALDGEDFSSIPCIVKPFPLTPSDDTEVLCKIDLED
jgi:hypothetical protein